MGDITGIVTPPGGASSANVYVPPLLTTAGIQASINAAASAGGGTVMLPAKTITLTGPLTLATCVSIIGAGWAVQAGGSAQTVVAGTILQGDGTFPCFQYNQTDLGSPYATAALLTGSLIEGISIQNLCISNFSYGIKIGALYQGGCQHSYFNNLYVISCTSWGVWIENFQSTIFNAVKAVGCFHGAGYFASGTNLYNFGNSDWYHCYGAGAYGHGSGRAMLLQARNGSQLNNVNLYSHAAAGTATTSTQAATLQAPTACTITNTSANIAVVNTAVAGEIVTFSAAVGTGGSGVVTTACYYVLASGLSGSNIQVSTTPGGTAITFNASGTPNVGWCKIGVTDMTAIGVGMACKFSATLNGFSSTFCWFVMATSGNPSGVGWVSLAGALGGNTTSAGVARSSQGASAVNIIFNGWQNFEIGGADQSSFVTYASVKGNSDTETGNSPRFVVNGVQGGDFEFGIIHTAGPLNDVMVVQSTQVVLTFQQANVALYLDSLALLQTTIIGGAPSGTGSMGLKTQNAGRGALNISAQNPLDDIIVMPTTLQLQMQNGLALQHSQQPAATTLTTAMGNLITYTGAVGTLTLPALSAVTMVGWQYWVSNPGASTLTVAGNGQNIVGLGVSGASVSVLTLQTALFVAHNNAGTMYWAQYK